MKNLISMQDLADALGVSKNTVSHALRDLPDISESLKTKVKDKAKELGYIPNKNAVSLKNGRTHVVALVYDNMRNPYFSLTAHKLISKLRTFGYDALIIPSSTSRLSPPLLRSIIQQRIEGVLTFLEPSEEALEIIDQTSLPVLLIGRKSDSNVISYVCTDDYKGGKLVADYLLENKSQKVIYVGPKEIECSIRRYEGLKDGLKNAKIIPQFYYADVIDNENISEIRSMLDENTGIVCFNDDICYSILSQIQNVKDKIKGIQMVGFDNIKKFLTYLPNITSVNHKTTEIAYESVESLNRMIVGGTKENLTRKVLDVSLVVREQ
ncbi:MAG TPA: LacI family DNA-binding transcriptional regulator [Bacilli bacterium]|nr:LacI family DNA-binding transcriptional regulator [Bacilli bacterium]